MSYNIRNFWESKQRISPNVVSVVYRRSLTKILRRKSKVKKSKASRWEQIVDRRIIA